MTCRLSSRKVSLICIQSAAAAAAAAAVAALCVAILLLLLAAWQQCCCFLLLFVIVCWMAKFVAGSLNLIPVFLFLLIETRSIFDGTPWQYCVVFTASICLHPRQLRACAEPRRASARRVQAPLALSTLFWNRTNATYGEITYEFVLTRTCSSIYCSICLHRDVEIVSERKN